jgi:DNA replication factor GINS
MDKGNKITYETLFDLLRNEKNREELQPLDRSFYVDLIEYINDKESLVRDSSQNTLFSAVEREKTLKQLDNTKKLVKELYERREKKILNLAMISSRAGGVLDKSALLPEEQKLFERLSQMLEAFKNDVLYRLLGGNLPELKEAPAQAREEAGPPSAGPKPASASTKDTLLVRFLHPVPKFVGSELEIYGPFEQEDIANLPKQIAEILISKGRAEVIQA